MEKTRDISKNAQERFSARETGKLYIRTFRLLWRHYPKYLLSTAFCKGSQTASPYITLYFSARFLDELAGARRPEMLTRWVILLLAVSALFSLLALILYRWEKVEEHSFNMLHTKEIYGKKLLEIDFEKMDDPATLDLLNQIEQSNDHMGNGMNTYIIHLEQLFRAIFQIGGGILLSYSLFTRPVAEQYQGSIGLKLGMIGAAAVILLTVLFRPFFSRRERADILAYSEHGKAANRHYWQYGVGLYDKTESALDMRIYRQDIYGDEELKVFSINEIERREMLFLRIQGFCRAGDAVLSHMMTGFIYLYVCLKAWFGAFGVGSVTQYVGAVNSIANGAAAVLNVVEEAKTNAFFLQRIFQFLEIPNEMYRGSLTVEKRNDRDYEVEFQDVGFCYPNASEYALRHVNMKFKVGKRLAVVGQNGSGKTTFIKLLCRLYDPTEGKILLNGIDIRKYDYQEYLSLFSVVFQDFRLLSLGLGQNVAAGAGYDAGLVRDCLEKAGLSEWLRKRPAGLETKLYKDLYSEEGVEISGGEEQKIAIARSMYRNAPFVILDEPTAALDPVSEYEIYTRFNDISTDCTAIYISHRLSSCRFCDEIAVFHQGSVIEQGTHQALLKKGGKYSELWNAQAQYYI